eukprot:251685_1
MSAHQLLSLLFILCIHLGFDVALQTNHCRDIHETCQELAIKGQCYDTDFVRHFCPISCRNPNCTDHFPSFTSKSTHWRKISSTTCHYSNIKHDLSSTFYFNHRINISLNQCQNECDRNPLCTHIMYIKNRILAQTPINPLIHLPFFTLNTTQAAHTLQYDDVMLHICVHSYIPSTSCHPICLNTDTLHRYLLNHKQDMNTQTHTAQLLQPFIFSTTYEYISPYSLYIHENRERHHHTSRYWNMMNEFNAKHQLIPYQSHEYYYPQMVVDGNAPPMLEAPKLHTSAGTSKVRLEFQSRVNRALEVSWINTRNGKEHFQDILEGNTWSVSKARNSFDGHVFVIRDRLTKEWVTSYRNNPSHSNVLITVTPYGVCVHDKPSTSGHEALHERAIAQLLRETEAQRWGSNSNLFLAWQTYEYILWLTRCKQTIGRVLNLMGQMFLFGAYDEVFDYDMAWSYFTVASAVGDGDAMYNLAFMIEAKLLPHVLFSVAPKPLYRLGMLNYWCSAQSHSAKAQLLLGFRYLNGIATNKSCLDSVFFYEKLAYAVRSDARSLDKYVEVIDLASPPPTRQDLNMDEDQMRYYQQYAAMGRSWANNHLGQVYLFGLRGIAQDYELAAQHFEAAVAAHNPDPIAANYLARLYWNGLGRPQNLNKTRELFTFAAERNVSQAQNNLAFMAWKGIGTAPNMTRALKWFKRAAAQGFAQAMFYLAQIYQRGDGVAANISLAVEYYIGATKRRHYRSMYELGILYRDGVGVVRDCDKAVALLKYVAEYHDVKFELEHARTSYEEAKYAQSFVIYAQKAEEGYVNGQVNAAYLAKNGFHKDLYDVNAPNNKELAFRYYSLAAAQNHSRSLRVLGDYYWYEWPPIQMHTEMVDEYDQRSMTLSIAYQHDVNRSRIHLVIDNRHLLRHEVIACSLYELASLQVIPKVNAQSLYDFAYCFEHGKGREKNISKARQIYWMAINKSEEATIPVFLTLLRMEASNHESVIENILLLVACVVLTIALCIKSTRNSNRNIDITQDHQTET